MGGMIYIPACVNGVGNPGTPATKLLSPNGNGELMRAAENDPEHWLQQAARARADAEALRDESLRLMLLAVAHGYESLAARAKQRLAEATPSKH